MRRIIVAAVIIVIGMAAQHEKEAWVIAIIVATALTLFAGHDPYPWSAHQALDEPLPIRPARTIKAATAPTPVLDEDAVQALMVMGFKRPAALAALNTTGWLGDTTEMRVVNALRSKPPVQ